MFYHTGKKRESQKKFVLPKEMSPSSVASKKLIFRTIPANPSLLPNPKDSQTMPLTSHFIVHKKFRIEIQAKFNLSMVP